jgi:hypothetical protein
MAIFSLSPGSASHTRKHVLKASKMSAGGGRNPQASPCCGIPFRTPENETRASVVEHEHRNPMKIPTNINPKRVSLKHFALVCTVGAGLGVGTAQAAAPLNDNFADAIELAGNSGSSSGNTNVDATFEVGEAVCYYPETTNTVWFKWVCTEAGSFTLSTAGSKTPTNAEWDAVVCIYTGSSLATLTQVKAQDTVLEESVNLMVSPGTYYIQAGGWADAATPADVASDIALSWSFVLPTVVDISNETTPGEPANPGAGVYIDAVVGVGNIGKLVGFTQTHWGSQGFSVPLDLNGNPLTIDSGGGNEPFRAFGSISGTGDVTFDTTWDHKISVKGNNSYVGATLVRRGWINLENPAGQDALLGTITLGSTDQARLVWTASNQINDAADVSVVRAACQLDLAGFSDTINDLTLCVGSKVKTGAGTNGLLRVTNLILDGTTFTTGAFSAITTPDYVEGSGYILVGGSEPPVLTDPPTAPASPVPADTATGLWPIYMTLDWSDSLLVDTYNLYFWPASDPRPDTPTAVLTLSGYAFDATILQNNLAYKWQVVAHNSIGDTESPEWTFTTRSRSDVTGYLTNPNNDIGIGNTANLIGDTTFGWQTSGCAIPVINNGFLISMDSGGGNYFNYTGDISGPGGLYIGAGGANTLHIGGNVGNTYTGATVVNNGPVRLEKISGNALCGAITVQGTGGLVWAAPDQISDTSDVTLTMEASLNLAGFSDTIASLSLAAGSAVKTGDGGVLTVSALTVDGAVKDVGTYTEATHPEFVTGTGSVVVSGGASTTYDDWKGLHAGGQAPGLDYDSDGVPNGVEYFMNAPDGFTANPSVVDGKVTWPHLNPVASFEVQVSDNLSAWLPAAPADIDTSTDPGKVIYTLPKGAALKFCRLAVIP